MEGEMHEFGLMAAARTSVPASRLEAYLELARRAREARDPFAAETIYRRAVLEARTVREAARVAEVVFLSWGTEDVATSGP